MSTEVFSYQVDSPYEEDIKFLTVVSESEGGKEQRYQKWLKPRRTFRIKLRARDITADADTLWRMYIRMKGSFDTFFFQNPNESPVTAETVGSGDGTKSVFYLGNKVSLDTGDVILVAGSLTVTRSIKGTGDYLAFAAYTVDNNLGQITTNAVLPSGDVLRGGYSFYYKCRFRDDNLTRQTFATNLADFGLELEQII